MRWRSFVILLLCASCVTCCQRDDLYVVHVIENPEVIAKAEQLPHQGIFKKSSGKEKHHETYFYLKVDDRFITELAPLLKEQGVVPDHHFDGAHITVFLDREGRDLPNDLPEVGHTYRFTIKNLSTVEIRKYVEPDKHVFIQEYMVIVEAPELEALRQKYGFSPLPYGKDGFHITIAQHRLKREE
jgi:hypothetical protein